MSNFLRVSEYTPQNKSEFIDELSPILCNQFNCDIDHLPENYGKEKEWSLISLLQSGDIDTYGILYVNNIVWCGSGGIIREHDGEKIYQIGFRGFSNFRDRHKGLGVQPLGTSTLIKHQIERAKFNKCRAAIMSFNQHNYKLFNVFKDHLMPSVYGKDAFEASQTTVLFNGVPQWLLTMRLN